ncbi:MAG TPA: hypothetical protein VLK65_06955 [Vicinamibacteria bacterium]|nr:hypothetical protein [Vicinamibacteria bacterium]
MTNSNDIRSGNEWWRNRFWAVMKSIGLARRLERGKRYARAQRVLALVVEPGLVTARVQGSRYEPYRSQVGLQVFSDAEWARAVGALASQALFSAKLLGGEMPENIEEAFAAVGLSLFPATPDELWMDCSCPDAVAPCKHIAALHFVLAERLDDDPFLLFLWRGRARDRILRELRLRRAAEASGQAPVPEVGSSIEEAIERFWKVGGSLDAISFTIEPPAVSASLLKRLGMPSFWKSHPEIRGSLERLYAKVTERAMALAYSTRDRE